MSVASAGLVLAGSPPAAQSATIVRSLTTEVVGNGSFDVLFDPVADASQLVSISAGSVYTDEGGSMVISAILDNDSIVQLFSTPSLGFFSTDSLAFFTGNTFTAFSSPVTVKGLRFLTVLQQTSNPVVTLPVGTTFTFTVPETTTALLSMFGVVFLGMRRART